MIEQRDEILKIARLCMGMRTEVRPEVEWVSEKYERLREEMGMISKEEMDQILSERMGNPFGFRNIRFWRTGRHMPANREQCRMFGRVLELTENESSELIRSFYNRSETIYRTIPGEEDAVYWKRRKCMEELQREYLMKIRPELFFRSNSTWESRKKNFRHLYFVDASMYTVSAGRWGYEDRSASMSFHSELNRIMQLQKEIPRKTMIRHLIILCMPYLSLERLNQYLDFFGYLPLKDHHTLISGEYLDWLLIRVMKLYEECCRGKEPEECAAWFQSCCQILDRYFAKHGKNELRFMYFKALKK